MHATNDVIHRLIPWRVKMSLLTISLFSNCIWFCTLVLGQVSANYHYLSAKVIIPVSPEAPSPWTKGDGVQKQIEFICGWEISRRTSVQLKTTCWCVSRKECKAFGQLTRLLHVMQGFDLHLARGHDSWKVDIFQFPRRLYAYLPKLISYDGPEMQILQTTKLAKASKKTIKIGEPQIRCFHLWVPPGRPLVPSARSAGRRSPPASRYTQSPIRSGQRYARSYLVDPVQPSPCNAINLQMPTNGNSETMKQQQWNSSTVRCPTV